MQRRARGISGTSVAACQGEACAARHPQRRGEGAGTAQTLEMGPLSAASQMHAIASRVPQRKVHGSRGSALSPMVFLPEDT